MMLVVNISYKGISIFMPKDTVVLLSVKILLVAIIGAICYALTLAMLRVKELEFILSFKSLKKR